MSPTPLSQQKMVHDVYEQKFCWCGNLLNTPDLQIQRILSRSKLGMGNVCFTLWHNNKVVIIIIIIIIIIVILLTARPWAERGSCSARGLFINRAAMGRARFLLCTGFFFFRFCVTRRRPPRMMSSSTNHRPNSHSAKCRHRMMSSSANYRPFLSSFRHTSPPESFD